MICFSKQPLEFNEALLKYQKAMSERPPQELFHFMKWKHLWFRLIAFSFIWWVRQSTEFRRRIEQAQKIWDVLYQKEAYCWGQNRNGVYRYNRASDVLISVRISTLSDILKNILYRFGFKNFNRGSVLLLSLTVVFCTRCSFWIIPKHNAVVKSDGDWGMYYWDSGLWLLRQPLCDSIFFMNLAWKHFWSLLL